jgi:PAS domain S-box-containing protein
MIQSEINLLHKVTEAIKSFIQGKVPQKIENRECESDEIRELSEITNKLIDVIAESDQFIESLAKGHLNVTPPPRNLLISQYKQLHSNLKHLTWQAQQVAKGDYSQKIDFLGEFSEAFNAMVLSLRQKRHLEEALRLTRFSIDRAGDAVFWMGPDARFIDANDRACHSLGYSIEEILSMTLHEIDPNFPPEIWSAHWEEIKRLGSFVFESQHRTKAGNLFPVEISVNYFEFEGKEYNCVFVRDITERKHSEESLKLAYQELKNTQMQLFQSAKLSSIGELSAGVAHELNQPLMVIRTTAQMINKNLRRNSFNKDALFKHIEMFEKNTKRMMNIINHLRTFSRQSQAKFTSVNINNVIEDCLLMVGEQLRLSQIALKNELSPELSNVWGNANQLEQVFLNLITNAMDSVNRRCRKGELGKNFGNKGSIEIVTRASDGDQGKVEILFKDTGGEISEENMKKIFDPFFTTKGVGEGTGLGLSISYGIIKDHKGVIEVAETCPNGTTFRVELPAI